MTDDNTPPTERSAPGEVRTIGQCSACKHHSDFGFCKQEYARESGGVDVTSKKFGCWFWEAKR